MSMRTLPGTVFTPQISGGFSIISDTVSPFGTAQRTPGITRVATLITQPSMSHKWSILGWSLRMRVGLYRAVNGGFGPTTMMATFGKLTAGLAVSALLSDQPYPILPPDMSTFTEVWDPNEPGQTVLQAASTNELDYKPLGITFMFPSPVTVQPGAELQYALILQRSLIHGGAGALVGGLGVRSADFTLLYDG